MSNDLHELRLNAFLDVQKELERAGTIASLNDWCEKAGIRWSTVGEFIAGRTQVPSDRTYAKLANAVGVPVHRLKGEQVVSITPRQKRFLDVLSRYSAAEQEAEIAALSARIEERNRNRQDEPQDDL